MENKKGFGYYIKIINKEFENNKNKDLAEFDLTSQQFSILIFLNKNKDRQINQKDIEEELNLSSPTVSGLLQRLENKEYVIRTTSESDSRYKVILSTEKGLKFKDIMFERIQKIEEELLANFTDYEKAQLIGFLIRMKSNICKEEIK